MHNLLAPYESNWKENAKSAARYHVTPGSRVLRLWTLRNVCVVAGFITYIYLNFDEIVEKQKVAVAKAEVKGVPRDHGGRRVEQKRDDTSGEECVFA